MDAIVTRGLTKYYGRTRGVEDVSLAVPRGCMFGFIGPNGAGKSTLIHALLGLIRPTAGQAEILGMDVAKDREKILARVGYLPAEAAFWPGMRVRDVLQLSTGLRRRDCRKQAEALCARLQLDPARRVEELSLGGRKKTSIVCALQHEPELLILDEPTGGLDPLMQREFFALLRERQAMGATVFLSSHILPEVQHSCARAAVIRAGRIIAAGPVSELAGAGVRRVVLRGHADLERLPGVREMHTSPTGADFLYAGDVQPLLAALAAGDVEDLTISEPDLEEVFLHWYEEGGAGT